MAQDSHAADLVLFLLREVESSSTYALVNNALCVIIRQCVHRVCFSIVQIYQEPGTKTVDMPVDKTKMLVMVMQMQPVYALLQPQPGNPPPLAIFFARC